MRHVNAITQNIFDLGDFILHTRNNDTERKISKDIRVKRPRTTGATLRGGFPKYFPESPHFSIDFPTKPANQANPITDWQKRDDFHFRLFTITRRYLPLILHASTQTWYRSIKESLFSLYINIFLLLTPTFPSFFSRNLPSRRFGHLLATWENLHVRWPLCKDILKWDILAKLTFNTIIQTKIWMEDKERNIHMYRQVKDQMSK